MYAASRLTAHLALAALASACASESDELVAGSASDSLWQAPFPEVLWPWPESEPLPSDVLRCGDEIRLQHVNTGYQLGAASDGSWGIKAYPSGSPGVRPWVIRGDDEAKGDRDLGCVAGEPLAPGQRLRLSVYAVALGIRVGTSSPITSQTDTRAVLLGNPDGDLRVEYVSGPGGAARYIRKNTVIRLVHLHSNLTLHSHAIPYGNDGGNEVTGFAGRDSNDYWTVVDVRPSTQQLKAAEVKPGELMRLRHANTQGLVTGGGVPYSHPGTSGQWQVFALPDAQPGGLWFGKQGTFAGAIRLENYLLEGNLHSHFGPPSPVSAQQEATVFGWDGMGDSNDDFFPEVEGGGPWLWWKRTRLVHANTNAALHSHPYWYLPYAGAPNSVQEVTAYAGRDSNDFFHIQRTTGGEHLRLGSVYTGAKNSCGVGLVDQMIYCWGANDHGQLLLDRGVPGVGFAVQIAPVREDIAMLAPGSTMLALNTQGKVIAWGKGVGGAPVDTGLSSIVSISSNRQQIAVAFDGTIFRWEQGVTSPTPIPDSERQWIVARIGTPKKVHAGGLCFTGDRAGHVACRTETGQLSDLSPLDDVFADIAADDLAVQAEYWSTCIFSPHAPQGDQVRCWEYAGPGVVKRRFVPTFPKIVALSGGLGDIPRGTYLEDDGSMLGFVPQVGYGKLQQLPPIVKVSPPGAGKHACGLDAQGHAYCWGDSDAGALGDGTFGRLANFHSGHAVTLAPF